MSLLIIASFLILLWVVKGALDENVNIKDDKNIKDHGGFLENAHDPLFYLDRAELLRWRDLNFRYLNDINNLEVEPAKNFTRLVEANGKGNRLFENLIENMIPLPAFKVNIFEEIYAYQVNADRAFLLWQSLQKCFSVNSYSPIIIGNVYLDFIVNQLDVSLNYLKYKPLKDSITYKSIFGSKGSVEDFAREKQCDKLNSLWGLTSITDFHSEEPEVFEQVYVLLVNCKSEGELLAKLSFGSWLSGPSIAEHWFAIDYLSKNYNVEIIGVTDFSIDIYISRPPVDDESATKLALELVNYAPNLLGDYDRSIDFLIKNLKNGEQIYLWWDFL